MINKLLQEHFVGEIICESTILCGDPFGFNLSLSPLLEGKYMCEIERCKEEIEDSYMPRIQSISLYHKTTNTRNIPFQPLTFLEEIQSGIIGIFNLTYYKDKHKNEEWKGKIYKESVQKIKNPNYKSIQDILNKHFQGKQISNLSKEEIGRLEEMVRRYEKEEQCFYLDKGLCLDKECVVFNAHNDSLWEILIKKEKDRVVAIKIQRKE